MTRQITSFLKSRGHWLVIGMAPLLLAAWLLAPTGQRVAVVGKTWRLEVDVERLVAETDSAWCAELPASQLVLERRSTQGRERCRFTSSAWRTQWLARAEGPATLAPTWPRPPLKLAGPDGLGAERLGRRSAFYELQLEAGDGKTWTCQLKPEHWQRMRLGMRLRLAVDRFGVASCGSLLAPD